MLRARTVVLTLAVYVLLTERFVVRMETGGSGVLSLLAIVTPVVIIALGVFPSRWRGFNFLYKRDFWAYWGLYIMLSFLLPIGGVLLHEYPPRTLFALLSAGLSVLFMWVGHWIADGPPGRIVLFKRSLVFLIIIQFLFAAGQYIYVHHHMDIPLLAAQFTWDRSAQALYMKTPVIGRSIGTYVNPNTLGVWAVMAFWAAALLLRGTCGTWCAILSLLTLLFSQSRGALAAIAVSLITFAFTRVANTLVGNVKVKPKTVANVLTVIIAMLFTILIMSQIIPDADRIPNIARAFVARLGEDLNWNARVLVWRRALELYRKLPWGTLGPPELMLGQFIDSEWIRLLLQGGVVLACAFVLSLLGGLRYITYRRAEKSFLAMSSVGLAVLSVTCAPMGYPPIALYWVCTGWCLADRRGEQGRKGVNASPTPSRCFREIDSQHEAAVQ